MNTYEVLPKDDGFQDCGTVCAANESRFTAAHYSEPLTAFTVGWKDREEIEEILNFIAPIVPVARRFEFKVADPNEAFLSETDDIRSIGSSFKRVEFKGTSVTSKTYNKGLTIRVDHDDVAGDDWRERYVQLLLQRLYRNELRRAIAALEANAVSEKEHYSWKTTGSSNPDADIRSELEAATKLTGIRPNRMIIGEGAWDIRSNAYDSQNNAGAHRSASLNLEELARKLFIDETRILRSCYQLGGTQPEAFLGNKIYLFCTQNGVMKDEPANIKRFVTPIDGSSSFRVYLEEHSKFSDITVEHYSNIVVTSETGIRKLVVQES